MSQRSEGGEGSTLIGTLSQIFSIFHFDASPKVKWLTRLSRKSPEIWTENRTAGYSASHVYHDQPSKAASAPLTLLLMFSLLDLEVDWDKFCCKEEVMVPCFDSGCLVTELFLL